MSLRGQAKKRNAHIEVVNQELFEKIVKKVVAQHKKDGRPLFIWEDGKVKKVLAK